MGELYEKVVKRLIEYRKELNITQGEMGEILGVTQGHFSKLEHEEVKISGESLKRLSYYNNDIDYFFSGQKKICTELDEKIMRCPKKLWYDYLEIVIWLLNIGMQMDGKSTAHICNKKQLVYLRFWAEKVFSEDGIWYGIRKANGFTQDKMSAVLDIYTKRYRLIEHGRHEAEVDAEILANLYERTGFYPSLTMGNELAILTDVNRLWIDLQDETRKMLNEKLDIMVSLLLKLEDDKCI